MRTYSTACGTLALSLALGGFVLTGTGCAGTRYERSTGAYIDDQSVNARVKTALFRDPVVSGFDVGVNTYRGNVQLSGFVETQEQKRRAADIAQGIQGVNKVINDLEIKPAEAVGGPGSSVSGSSERTTVPASDIETTPATPPAEPIPAPTEEEQLRSR
jgi:hypothetical protein